MIVQLINFCNQSVTIKKALCSNSIVFKEQRFIHSISILNIKKIIFTMIRSDGQFFSLLGFPFVEKYSSETCYIFSPLFSVHCYSPVLQTLCLFQKLLFLSLKRFLSIETKKLCVKFVVPKIQNLVFYVTGRVILLGHCYVPIVPISPRSPRVI